MKETWPIAVEEIGQIEAGYQRHHEDSGNWYRGRLIGTNRGISAPALARYLGRTPTVSDMRNLSKTDAITIFQRDYWNVLKCDELPQGVDLVVFDLGVNAGPGRAAKTLQLVIGATCDGKIGPETMEFTYKKDPGMIVRIFCDARRDWMRRLRNYRYFGSGWEARVDRIEQKALELNRD